MQWTNNAKIFNLYNTNSWNDLESFKEKEGTKLLITVTDESMYDRYHPNDTVEVIITDTPPDNSDCLIALNNEVSFRQVAKDPDDDSQYVISRTWPFRSSKVKKEDLNILGYATGILRV